ncbi:MAG: hypothetical protein UY41_C0018G0018 [Candidatus Moranbacteria bacterium GW2011_GWE1_49_15]|nr:MAG: hypothetical protein UX75_C0040G0006 [Candidatus Moranbacteria bacterium GW2011_GWE2_47_10]KKW06660.1 MAG: hypothetical protein UY41_C0018G0018 [Candidatus Moranbacteria bacterium GW2011_GWE1_49_15]HBP00713.1 hypothetical protein [Candidatus Moranbacteria bacterium]
MPKKILSCALLVLMSIAAFFSWHSVDRAIFAEGASDFWLPLVWLSLFAVFLSLSIVLVREKIWVWSALAVSLLLSLIFVHAFLHLGIVALAWVFVFAAGKSIGEDIESSLRIHLMKSLYRGIFLVVIAFALMISSQYYFSVRNLDSRNVAPDISSGGVTTGAINLILPRISPEFRQAKSDEITMDDFLGEIYETIIRREGEELKSKLESGANDMQKEQAERILEIELGRKLTSDERKQLESLGSAATLEIGKVSPQIKQEVLEEWKKELSKSAGFEVEGQEKVADIFVAIANAKIEKLAAPKADQEKSGVLPLIFSMIMFFTLITLGSVLSRFWIAVAAAVFWVLKKTGAVRVETETKEAEVIR